MERDKETRSKKKPPVSPIDGWVHERGWWSRWIERLALWVERPINQFSNTTQLNPFYHTGTIAVFLLGVVAVTGFYLYIFFGYGFEASYAAVLRLEGQPIGRFMRALHRYASGALLVTTLLHALRILFMERFRGPRWLAWLTGVIMTAFIWGAGVTGYWLLWDERAQVINGQFGRFLGLFGQLENRYVAMLIAAETGSSWQILFLILVGHILLFLLVAGFFILHIWRLHRPKWMPEVPWLVGMGVVLIIGSVLFPVGVLPAADLLQVPAEVTFDPLFLFFLPFEGTAAWVLWGVLLAIGVLLTALPWLPSKAHKLPRVEIIDENCTGCTRCAVDCPYKAIDIVALPEGSAHKYLAVADPALCVSCGICIGSCLDNAITLGDAPPDALWQTVKQRIDFAQARVGEGVEADVEIVFACERYANQSARPYLQRRVEGVVATHEMIEVIGVPCAGAVPPDVLTYALAEGAAEVRIVGCPPDDCANREGNMWEEQRLTRERVPKLRRRYANVPISAVWLPPDAFAEGLAADVTAEETNWLETRRMLSMLSWQNFLPAFAMLGVVMLLQILFSNVSWTYSAAETGVMQVVVADFERPFSQFGYGTAVSRPEGEVILSVLLDGEVAVEERFLFTEEGVEGTVPFVWEVDVAEGAYVADMYFEHAESGARFGLVTDQFLVERGRVVRLIGE